MNKYNTILFDLDDTILDFKRGEKNALNQLFKELKLNSEKNIFDDYNFINQSLWREYEKGNINIDFVLNNRFLMLLKKYNKDVDGKIIEKKYRNYLNLQHDFIEGAEELLKYLHKKYKLYIITNGISETQYKRLQDAKIDHYFEKIFISGDIGYQKPKKEFFEAVISEIPNFDTNAALIVGDSLNTDIFGGLQLNIDTCWFNPSMKENNTNIKSTYEIHRLSELKVKFLND